VLLSGDLACGDGVGGAVDGAGGAEAGADLK